MKIADIIIKILANFLSSDLKINISDIGYIKKGSEGRRAVLLVTVDLINTTYGGREVLKIIAKHLPVPDDQKFKKYFSKELFMYRYAIPEYIRVQRQQNIGENPIPNVFPQFYGGSMIASVFLIKHLTSDGFILADLLENYDVVHTKLVIDKISLFHATGIAIKKQNATKYKSYLEKLAKPSIPPHHSERIQRSNEKFRRGIKEVLVKNDKLSKYYEKVDKLIQKIDEKYIREPREPFSTMTHNDLWIKNIFFRYNKSEVEKKMIPTEVKFIDFEYCKFGSPFRDISHFIFTSTLPHIQADFYNLTIYYYNSLIKYLKLLNCSCTDFTIEKFDEERKNFGWIKFKHTLLFIIKSERLNNKNETAKKLHHFLKTVDNNGWL